MILDAKTHQHEVSEELSQHLVRIRGDFVDKMWKCLFVVALVAAPLSAMRGVVNGWQPLYSLHVAIALLTIGVVPFLNKLSLATKSALAMGVMWALGVPGIFAGGLIATSVWWLVLSCLVASIIYSVRAGAITAGATIVVLAIAAATYVSGTLTLGIDANLYHVRVSSWVALIGIVAAFTFVMLQSVGGYTRSMTELLAEITRQRAQIEALASHDELTGLPLFRLAEDRIAMAVERARRSSSMVAILFIDLDGFKAVNDTFGHAAGDRVLKEVALRLVGAIRAQDTVARVGGDEFMAILDGVREQQAAAEVAAKVVKALSLPIHLGQCQVAIGASVGISIFPDHSGDIQELRQLADRAMYSVKKSGKNHFAFATASHPTRVAREERDIAA